MSAKPAFTVAQREEIRRRRVAGEDRFALAAEFGVCEGTIRVACRGMRFPRKRTDLRERFFAKTQPEPNSGCLLWLACCDDSGYGSFALPSGKRGGPKERASRVAWELAHGPIPDALQALHTCDTRCCVNVDHLFLGTNKDNVDDRDGKGRQIKGIDHPRAVLTDDDVRTIREAGRLGTASRGELAERYSVSTEHIGMLIKGTRRQHVGS